MIEKLIVCISAFVCVILQTLPAQSQVVSKSRHISKSWAASAPSSIKSFSSPAPESLDQRQSEICDAWITALTDLTYCYPDVKFGRLTQLDKNARVFNSVMSDIHKNQGYGNKGAAFVTEPWSYPCRKYAIVGHVSRSFEIKVKVVYSNVQRESQVLAETDWQFETHRYPYSGCYCDCSDDDFNFKTNSESECNEANRGKSAPMYQFYPSGYEAEIAKVTITVYPLLFENNYYYHQTENEPWITSRDRALVMILLHEIGHIEYDLNNDVKYSDSVSFPDFELNQDNFASSVLRCIE